MFQIAFPAHREKVDSPKCKYMDKESIYLLQKIDCNCNDCKCMLRDFNRYQNSVEFNNRESLKVFNREKDKLLAVAWAERDWKEVDKLQSEVPQFDKPKLNYGVCIKFQKFVSFIPNTCQLETQECFEHRKG